MSDSESSDDGTSELQDLLAEYEEKSEDKSLKDESTDEDTGDSIPESNEQTDSLDVEGSLDKAVFGDRKGLLENFAKAVDEDHEVNTENEGDGDNDGEGSSKRRAQKRKPAWTDADDEQIQFGDIKKATKHTGPLDHLRKDKSYKEHLTTRFTRIVSQPKWASLDKPSTEGDNSDDDDILHTVGFLANPGADTLPPHNLNCKRLRDLNRSTYAEGRISSVQFLPNNTAALVAGNSGVATVYAIDGRENKKLHSIHFKSFPIKCAKITPCGTKAIFGSFRDYYYSYDLSKGQETRYRLPHIIKYINNFQISPCGRYMAAAGRFGQLYLFDTASHELLHTYHQENRVASIRFTSDSRRIICNSRSPDVSIFSLRKRCLEHTFVDNGCIVGHALDLSSDQHMLATGSNEGAVNVYDFDKIMETDSPLPDKVFLNLTTAISEVKFNPTCEVLAMSSQEVRGAIRLAHFPSATVFANFPQFNSGLQATHTIEFSPGSGYMALGGRSTEVSLFRIKHYNNY